MMHTFFARRVLCAALPLMLCACAGLAPQPDSTPSLQLPAAGRTYQDAIDLAGRLSIRYQSNGKDEALHGSFTWVQTRERTTVTLLSPLGQTVAVISATLEGATLTQGGQPARSARDVDQLTADALGWPLPVSGLRDWLQGFAIDSSGGRFVATPQRSETLTRDGWHLQYTAWQEEDMASNNRPRRIDLARSTPQAGEVAIRIVIDTWQTP